MSKAHGVAALFAVVSGAALAATLAAAAIAFGGVNASASGFGEIVAACRRWSLLDGGVGSLATFVVGAVAIAMLGSTLRSATRQLRATRRFVRRLTVTGVLPGSEVVRVVADDRPLAFCVGLLRPRAHISTGALRLLDGSEREAVLAHEAHHVRCRDPLRLLVFRALADGLFVLPVLRQVSARFAALAELAADEAAERATGGPRALASALRRFDDHPDPAVVGIAPERVDRMLGARTAWRLPIALLAVSALLLAAVGAVLLRLAQSGHVAMSLPEAVVQACMLAMAVVPLVAGAGLLLGARRVLHRP